MNRQTFLFYLFLALPLALAGQITPLEINTGNHCQYTGAELTPKLSRLLPLDSVEIMVREILDNTGKEQNFELVAANVKSAVAIVDDNKRYLLYSRRHFIEQTDPTYRYGILAHEIGHHVNGHKLVNDQRRAVEEYEADYYMGYALFRVGRPRNLVATMASRYPLVYAVDSVQRQKDILRGYDKSEASIEAEAKSGFAYDGSGGSLPGIPEMPFPPPGASATHPLTAFFRQCKFLKDVDAKLVRALDAAGFYEKGYFYVKDGFAMVTAMEQFRSDGYSHSEANRWNSKPVREEAFSILGYLEAVFTAQPGRFRVFAFVATDEAFVFDKNRKFGPDEIPAWSREGANKLPALIGNIPYSPQTRVEGFVYEIEVKEGGGKGVFVTKSKLGGKTHFENAKILPNLQR